MSLLDVLGLPVPKHLAVPVAVPPARPAPAASAAPTARAGPGVDRKKGGKPKVAVDMDGPVATVKVVKLSLGALRWKGHQGQLLAFTDAAGKLVTNGPRAGWRTMASGNMFSGRIVHALADLDKLEQQWRGQADRVRRGTVDGEALRRKVEGAMAAVRQRKAKDEKFREAMNAYFDQLSALPPLAEKIAQADAEFEAALSRLGEAVKQEEIEKVEEQVKAIEGDIAAVKAEAEQVKAIVGKVLTLGTEIRSFAVAPSATAAIGLLSQGVTALTGAIVDGQYAGTLGRLDAQLGAAQADLAKLKHEKSFFHIKEAQANLKSAVSKCREADLNFNRQVKEMTRKRATAQDKSGESPATRIVGEVIARRARQRQLIFELRSLGETYLRVLKPLAENIPKVRDKFSHVGDWIDDIAVDDPRLARGSAWANASELTASSNAYELGNWIERVAEVRRDCQKVLKEVEEAGAAAATAPYDQALELVEEALSTSDVK
jgi:predicted  nucleic acid-binding Zn-ribbon protein